METILLFVFIVFLFVMIAWLIFILKDERNNTKDLNQLQYNKGLRDGKLMHELHASTVLQQAEPYTRRAILDSDILAWSKRTFKEQDGHSIMLHLLEEIRELNLDVLYYAVTNSTSVSDLADGIADVYILLITLADYYDVNLYLAVEGKHNVNLGRYWEYDKDKGYHKHTTSVLSDDDTTEYK